MSNHGKFSRMAGLAVAAATLLALAPAGIASADDSVITVPTTGTETITINTEGANGTGKAKIAGHSFKAVQIGSYEDATGDATNGKLSAVAVGTTSAVAAGATAALTATGASTDSAYTGNPVGQVAAQYLGYTSTANNSNSDTTSQKAPYSGKLRDFATSLVTQSDFKTALNAATAVTAADGTATIQGLVPGIYVVEDVTAASARTKDAPKNSIPMLLGTTITVGNPAVTYNSIDGQTLGTISMKSDSPTVTKQIGNVTNPSIGSYVPYTLKTSVPLTTGFSHYLFTLTDTPAAGMQFATDDSHKAVVKADSDTLTEGTDYEIVSDAQTNGDTKYVVFDLSKYAENTANYDKSITVSYYMQIDNNASSNSGLGNSVTLSYSSDAANAPATDKPALGDNGVPVVDCPADATAPCENNNALTINDKVAATGGTAGKIYIKHFSLNSKAKSDDSMLPGAQFTITEQGSDKAIKFILQADGFTYKKAVDQSDANTSPQDMPAPTSTLTVPSDATNKGKLTIDGLAAGDTYTVVQTKAPANYSDTFNPSFKVTTGAGASTNYTNTGDTWGLVKAHAADDMASVDNDPIVVYAVNGVSQLPMTGGAGAILGVIVAVLLLGTAGCLYVLKKRESNAAAAANTAAML